MITILTVLHDGIHLTKQDTIINYPNIFKGNSSAINYYSLKKK